MYLAKPILSIFYKLKVLGVAVLTLSILFSQGGLIAEASSTEEYMLYSTSATHIQVVPLVTTGLPDPTTGVAVTGSAYCAGDTTIPASSRILPLAGEWITIWSDSTAEESCYSRFSANGSGGYDETEMGTWPYGWGLRGIDDLDGDGIDDLVLARLEVTSVRSYQYFAALGQSDGSFDFSAAPITYIANTWTSSSTVADADGDGHSDFVYFAFAHGGSNSTAIQMYAGNGDGTFSTTSEAVFTSPHGAGNITFADFNEDSYDDIYLSPDDDISDMGQSHMATNDGSSAYTLSESIDFRPSDEGSTSDTFSASARPYDVNLDGHIDLVTNQAVWDGGPYIIEVYWGDGTGNFATSGATLVSGHNTGDSDIPRIDWGPLNGSRDTECVAPPAGMVAWWTLDETTGPMSADIALYANDGTHTNNPVPTSGMVDGALSFDGTNYVEVPSHDEINFGQGDLSIDAWVKTTDSSGVKILVDKRYEDGSRNTQGYSLFLGSGELGFQLGDGDGTWFCSSDPDASSCTNYGSGVSVADGEWHFVAVTVDRDDPEGGRFYIDGSLVSTFNPTVRDGSLDNDKPLRIASRSSFETGLFRGEIDEIELFNRVLTDAEIESIYAVGSAGKCKCEEKDVVIQAGEVDDFASPNDPAQPSDGLREYINTGYGRRRNFDNVTSNRAFGHTLADILPEIGTSEICSATLEIRVKPAREIMHNDVMALRFIDANGNLLAAPWSRYFGSGEPKTGLFDYQWGSGDKSAETITLDLGALPLAPEDGGGTVSILGLMNTLGFLDVYIQDDTAVDYIKLHIHYCCDHEDGPDIEVTKSHAGEFHYGKDGTYNLVVTNVGNADAPGPITVIDRLPAGMTFVSGGGSGWNCSAVGQTVTCTHADPLPAMTSALLIPIEVAIAPVQEFPNVSDEITNCAYVEQAWDVNRANDADCDTVAIMGAESADIYITPADHTISVSGLYTVDIQIDNIQDFYGNQLEVHYDPTIVEVIDADDSSPGTQILHGGFLVQDTVIKNIADNDSGVIKYSTSFRGNKPGVNGSGVLAQIVFRGLMSGTSPISLHNIVLSDPQSVAIQVSKRDGQVVVEEQDNSHNIHGQLILERRGDDNNSGAEVCVGAQCVTTGDDGAYALNDVPANGNVEVRRQSYLSSTHAYSSTGGLITLPDVTLLGGDINQDGFININDAVLVGMAWQSTPTDPHWDVRADVTDDSKVDILDMVAVQFNWNEVAPGPWAVVQAARRSTRSVIRAASVEGIHAADAEAQVAIAPSFSTIKKLNETTKVDIMAEDVTGLYGFTVVSSFDPEKIQVVDLNVGDLLDPGNQFVVINQIDNENGLLELSVTQTYPATPKNGSGVLGTVTFESVGIADTAIALTTATRLVDSSTPNPQDIAATMQDGMLRLGTRSFLPMLVR